MVWRLSHWQFFEDFPIDFPPMFDYREANSRWPWLVNRLPVDTSQLGEQGMDLGVKIIKMIGPSKMDVSMVLEHEQLVFVD